MSAKMNRQNISTVNFLPSWNLESLWRCFVPDELCPLFISVKTCQKLPVSRTFLCHYLEVHHRVEEHRMVKHFYLHIWGTYSKSEEGFFDATSLRLKPDYNQIMNDVYFDSLEIYDEWLKDGRWWIPKVNKLAYKNFPKFSKLACILSLTY